MSIFLNREVNFSQVSNYALRDQNLSRKAKGLYAEIYSYITIPNFKLSKSYLMKTGIEGETAFNSIWKELKEKGYLKQYRISVNNNGVISFIYKYNLLDKPDVKTPYLTNVKLNGEFGETYGGLSENIENSEQEKPLKTYPPTFVPGTRHTRYTTYQVHDMEGINNTDINNTDINNTEGNNNDKSKKVSNARACEYNNSISFNSSIKKIESSKIKRESFDQLIDEHIKKGVAFYATQRDVLKQQLKKFLQLRFMHKKGFTNSTFQQFLEKLLDNCDYDVGFQIYALNKSLIAGYNDVFEPDYNKIFEDSLDRFRQRRKCIIRSRIIEIVNKKYSTDYQANFEILSAIDNYIIDEYYSQRYSEEQIIDQIMEEEDAIILDLNRCH